MCMLPSRPLCAQHLNFSAQLILLWELDISVEYTTTASSQSAILSPLII